MGEENMGLRRKLAWLRGFDLQRIRKSESAVALAFRLMDLSRSSLVLDVGANEGQFALDILKRESSRRIVSFEPLPGAYDRLRRNAARYPVWTVAERMAIGEADGVVQVNASEFSPSSSIRESTERNLKAFPGTSSTGKVDAPLKRLDEVAGRYSNPDDRFYLKIDTQGFEREVIKGSTGIMDRIVAVQAEMNLVPMYDGAALMDEMVALMSSFGFKLFGISNGSRDPETSELLEADGFFIR
jgi:FkbM family methyltransferase